MCGIETQKTRMVGMITISIFLVFQVAILIYNGVSSGLLSPKGSNVAYNIFSSLEYFVLFLNIVMSLIGFFGFFLTNKGLNIYFTIVQCIALIISLWITIALLVVGSFGTKSERIADSLSCYDSIDRPKDNPGNIVPLTNLSNQYRYEIDYFLTTSDELFCSKSCPCAYNGPNISSSRSWVTNNEGPVSFNRCPLDVKIQAQQSAINKGYFGSFEDVDSTMNWLETKFNCVGFCVTNYTDSSGRSVFMDKYLFSNVNRGKPENNSCFLALVSWIVNYCLVLGILDVFIVIFNLFLLILGYIFWCNFKDPIPQPTTYGVVSPIVQGQPVEFGNQQRYVPNFGENNYPANQENVPAPQQPIMLDNSQNNNFHMNQNAPPYTPSISTNLAPTSIKQSNNNAANVQNVELQNQRIQQNYPANQEDKLMN